MRNKTQKVSTIAPSSHKKRRTNKKVGRPTSHKFVADFENIMKLLEAQAGSPESVANALGSLPHFVKDSPEKIETKAMLMQDLSLIMLLLKKVADRVYGL